MKCPFCETENRQGETLCIQCGKLIGKIPNRRVCSLCGREIPDDKECCPVCLKCPPFVKLIYLFIAVIVAVAVIGCYFYISHHYVVGGDKGWFFWKT